MTSPSPPAGRLSGLDTLRGLAAVAVLVCHIAGYWTFMNLPWKLPQLMALGAHGVDVFIVISGFVLFLPVVRAMGSLDTRQFYGRRVTRILPAYYVALAIAAILAMGPRTWDLVVAEQAGFPELLLHLLGIQTWFPGSLGTINGSLWSISLELHLYLVFPVLVAISRRWGMAPLIVGSIVLAGAWSMAGALNVSGPLGFGLGGGHALPARLLQFVLGMWCAILVARGLPLRVRTWAWSSAGFALAAAVTSTAELNQLIADLAWGGTGVCLILLVCSLTTEGGTWESSERFGERSYSFYLLHQPVLLLLAPVVSLLPGWPLQLLVGGAVALVLVSVLATVLFKWVELPTHRLGRRLFPSVTHRGGQAAQEVAT